MVAYIFVLLGVVAERVALTMVYLDIVLYSAGGVIGTMHHLYFSGTPAQHMALGAFFSAGEVIPLTFLTVEAWSFLQLGAAQAGKVRTPFPHRWAVMFLASVGFWNFLGAGIFGFLVNLPIVSCYEIGTALTANHAHAAMMGVYGMLAAGLALFCVRYVIPPEPWSDRLAAISFWSLNIGLAWMCFATLFPLGILQLYESVSHGYFEARSLQYLTNSTNALIEWLRFPGDLLMIGGGVLPLLYLCWLGVRYRIAKVTLEEPEHPLFTEVTDGEHLSLVGVLQDERRVARYRARPAACNRCPLKSQCTDSDTGRELERELDDWPRSEITRFYHGLALTLVVLATFIGSVGLVRNHGSAELVVLAGGLALVAFVGRRMALNGLGRR
jgi:nitric oxide reductase subunit B